MKRQEIIFSPRLRLLAVCFRPERELALPHQTQAIVKTTRRKSK